jgi:hypothetical protein
MHVKSTKEIGKELENQVLAELERYEPHARLTRNSGGTVEKLDILSRYLSIECKNRRKKNIEFLLDDWQKLLRQAHKTKIPLYFVKDKSGRIGVMLREADLWPAVWANKSIVNFEWRHEERKTITITDDEWIIDNQRPETILVYRMKNETVWGQIVICGWFDFWNYFAKELLEDR